jgi:DNA invertase Pin-like site-specific DNA recombinase
VSAEWFKSELDAAPVNTWGAVAAYVRVSSAGQSLAAQSEAIRRAARARGDKLGRWYREKVSARTLDRPELAALRAAVRRGEVRKLYVFRIDRLTRSGIRDTLALLDELGRGGCEVVTIADGFELAGPARDVVLAVISWAAEMERRALGERISAARARAERWGRPRRTVDVARARELAAKGKSLRQIAAALKVPLATLARRLAGVPKTYPKSAPKNRVENGG